MLKKSDIEFINRFKNIHGRIPNMNELEIHLIVGGSLAKGEMHEIMYSDIIFGIANHVIEAYDVYYTHTAGDLSSATIEEERIYNIEKNYVMKKLEG